MPELMLWIYATAPTSPILAPYGISERQLRRLVADECAHQKIGQRVFFTDDDLRAIVASFQRGR